MENEDIEAMLLIVSAKLDDIEEMVRDLHNLLIQAKPLLDALPQLAQEMAPMLSALGIQPPTLALGAQLDRGREL